jgi:predicted alpha/beta hydrolase
MKKLLFTYLFIPLALTATGQTRLEFDAAVDRFKQFYNLQQADSIFNMLSDHSKSIMTREQTEKAFAGLYKASGKLTDYEFKKQKEAVANYKTVFEHAVFSLYLSLNKDNKLEDFRFLPYKEEKAHGATGGRPSNFRMKAGTDTLYGTITLPEGNKKWPVALIIAGSGPTDRDCNSSLGATTNAFMMLADSLQKAGIASLRYDKRGVGESKEVVKDKISARFDDLVNDATDCIKMLKADARFSEVYVIGHSEGSLVGMLAAAKEQVAGYISLSGAGETVDKLIEKQVAAQSESLAGDAKVILDSIARGYTAKAIPAPLEALFHESGQPYLRSWMKYDPQVEIRKLKIPVLIIQGTTDLQVGVQNAERLKKGCRHAKVNLVTGMNHVLKQAPIERQENFSTYNNPTLPLSGGLIPEMVAFINAGRIIQVHQ